MTARIIRYLLMICATAWLSPPAAFAEDISTYFEGQSACLILYDTDKKQMLVYYNPRRCKERIPPDSTFKIALSLMAFDQNLITQDTVFKWDGKKRDRREWDRDQTPQTWLADSVVWVSQTLTPKLGMEHITHYLQEFHYGNENFSGDPILHNGLTTAWLSSSLKISANEQFYFLKAMLEGTLPVSKDAMANTKANMDLGALPDGWELYGKTGSGRRRQKNAQDGWFVGFEKSQDRTRIVVLNMTELQPSAPTAEPSGFKAREIAKQILAEYP